MSNRMKVAISGKGGVGKTTIAAVLARSLQTEGLKVLAIDADPNSNLALALGMPPQKAEEIVPIAENAKLVEEKTGVGPDAGGALFRLTFRVDDLIERFAIETPSRVSLIVMGAVRSAGQGCMCPANALIRALLRHVLTGRDEAVIVDLEAGVEHFGRGTAEHVDAMLVVAEPSLKSLETAKRIHRLAVGMGVKAVFVVGNKIADLSDAEMVEKFCAANKLSLLGLIPYDDAIRRSDALGAMSELDSKGAEVIRRIGDKLLSLRA